MPSRTDNDERPACPERNVRSSGPVMSVTPQRSLGLSTLHAAEKRRQCFEARERPSAIRLKTPRGKAPWPHHRPGDSPRSDDLLKSDQNLRRVPAKTGLWDDDVHIIVVPARRRRALTVEESRRPCEIFLVHRWK